MKLCKDCLYVKPVRGSYEIIYQCTYPDAPKYVNPMSGRVTFNPAAHSREDEKLCGKDAKWFKEAPHKTLLQRIFGKIFGE